jgi:hypothetical protein
VVICIRFVLAEEFMCFTGYVKITKDLQSYGFLINLKKVCRLMKEHHLLCGMVIHTRGEKRHFVRWRVQQAVRPMQELCTDIKYVYIHGEKRPAVKCKKHQNWKVSLNSKEFNYSIVIPNFYSNKQSLRFQIMSKPDIDTSIFKVYKEGKLVSFPASLCCPFLSRRFPVFGLYLLSEQCKVL